MNMLNNKNKLLQHAFTIVEILVVIVVIGILAAIVTVSYSATHRQAVASSMKSDITDASQQLNLFHMEHGAYPTTISTDCVASPDTATNKCLKFSSGSTYTYNVDNSTVSGTFGLTVNNSNLKASYRVVKDSGVVDCAPGFIIVPGSETYGTHNFCVMKYEAKNAGGGIPVSTAAGTPYGNINQPTAVINSQNVAGCTGCHLITEAEWLTIAQNIISVPNNWSSGTVGTGYVYRGHSDSKGTAYLAASPNDSLGYHLETTPANDQRRTLTLTNGEVIWDFAGNVYEWTTGLVSGGQPGVDGGGLTNREWNAVTTHGTLSPDPYPATAYAGASSWTSANGIGMIDSNSNDNTQRTYLRGGYFSSGTSSGIFYLCLADTISSTAGGIGFRVAK